MSDTEQKCLQTAASICSDQESLPYIHSVSSIDFVQRQKQNMSEDPDFRSLHPGRQKPPHHGLYSPVESSGQQDNSKTPVSPPRQAQATNQWSFDASESQSGETGSPRKDNVNEDIPTFSVSSKTKFSQSETDTMYEDMQKHLMDEGIIVAHPVPPQNPKKPRSREHRKSKGRHGKESEDMAMQKVPFTDPHSVEPVDSFSEQFPKEVGRKRGSKKRCPEASSIQNTGEYTKGVKNPAFDVDTMDDDIQRNDERRQASDLVRSSTTQVTTEGGEKTSNATSSKKPNHGVTAVFDDHGEDNPLHSYGDRRHFSQLKHRSLHAATVQKHNLSSETWRNIFKSRTADYISSHIKQRECCQYAPSKDSENTDCQCGQDIEWHKRKGLPIDMNCERFSTRRIPCNSFGEIHFVGFGSQSHNSPYMRVDSACDMDKVLTVLIDCWKLPHPRMIISVTGGAKRFKLRPRLKNILKQGLVNAAVSTGAWIITGGTATGVMEIVGEAVHDHIEASGDNLDQCVALGIASWGTVANNQALVGDEGEGLFPADYCMEDINKDQRKCAPLDHNHSHFLLVDDGRHRIYGGEIDFRAKLESHISQMETGVTETQSVNVPTVLIVVEGGINTMETVRSSINCDIPVVIIENSGRAADFISIAFRITKPLKDDGPTLKPSNFHETMRMHARKMFEWKEDMPDNRKQKRIDGAVSCLEDILKKRNLLNIFNLHKADSVKDIDRAILYALLRANKSNAHSQLALALTWNRCDIARQEIFIPENRKNWQQVDLNNAMFTALVQNRADFVQLFLDNGVDLKRFLTIRTLWNLYSNCIDDETSAEASLLRGLISYLKQTWGAFLFCRGTVPDFESFPDLLPYIDKVIVHLLQDQSFRFYSGDEYLMGIDEKQTMTWKDDDTHHSQNSTKLSSADHGKMSNRHKLHDIEPAFEHPERELFIWAVLFNRRQLTGLFWRNGHDHLGSALFASALLYRLSQLADAEEEAELSRDMMLHSDECERLAVNVLSECYSQDKHRAHELLIRPQTHWGNVTLFKLAESYELMEFAEQSACQTKLSSIWKGHMALYTSEIKIFLCVFLPILLRFIKFKDDASDKEDDNDLITEDARQGFMPHKNQVGPKLPDDDGDGQGFVQAKKRRPVKNKASKLKQVTLFGSTTDDNISLLMAIYFFYQAPVTKFFCNIISYILFTGLFSYVVLVKLAPTGEDSPSVSEYLVWGWLCTMIMEEFRQLFIRDQRSMKYKFRSWFSNVWNRFDAAIYLLFIVAIILRYQLTEERFVWARVTYSITLAMLILRFMQFFYVEKNLGPKVIMIRKMLTDLMFFFLILLVFMASFGVAYHANMFPEAPLNWSILANVFYYPYFQMYGELFLEDLKGEGEDCSTNETIWRSDPFKRCSEENAVVPVLLALYMMLTNILLVNLLIAMFSYTFQTVQDNSLQVWRFYRLTLVFEYFDRPTLVPPIIIFNHMFRLIRYAGFKLNLVNKRSNSFRLDVSKQEQNRFMLVEKSAVEHQLSQTRQMSKLTLDGRVKSTAKRLETVMDELQVIKEAVQQQEIGRAASAGEGDTGLDSEGGLLELGAASAQQRPISANRPLPPPSSQEMDSLRKTMQEITAQSSATSQRVDELTQLLRGFIAEQKEKVPQRMLQPPAHLDVEDLEDQKDAASEA